MPIDFNGINMSAHKNWLHNFIISITIKYAHSAYVCTSYAYAQL